MKKILIAITLLQAVAVLMTGCIGKTEEPYEAFLTFVDNNGVVTVVPANEVNFVVSPEPNDIFYYDWTKEPAVPNVMWLEDIAVYQWPNKTYELGFRDDGIVVWRKE